jgi:hypothetical protein
MISYSEDQARAFVTNAGTWQRAQQLGQPAKWNNLGRTDSTAWGECAGSGSKPYLTGIDLSEPAFKCSCPSRVFPCKHGAGLLLLLARQPALFTEPTVPAWLEEWLAKRQQTQEKKVDKAGSGFQAPADVLTGYTVGPDAAGAAQKDAVAPVTGNEVTPARLARMAQGTDDLEVWLLDLMRNGLATLDQQPANFWESQAARLVDNQLPGLAGSIRELVTLRQAHADWPSRLLARLGEVYWLVRAFQNREQLPAATRQEVLQQVGVTIKKEELPTYGAPLADEWRVVGQFTWEEDRLTARRSWLHGQATGRYALLLEFAFGSQPFATPLVPGGRYVGELAFYPGLLPLRAATTGRTFGEPMPATAPPGGPPSQLLDDYANALAVHPWLREWPATLTQVQPVRQLDGSWLLYHATEGGALPLRFADDNAPWQLLAQSGGHPMTLFGEWDGRAFRPLGSWLEGATVAENRNQPAAPTPEAPSALTPEQLPSWAQLLRGALLGTRQSGEPTAATPLVDTPTDSPEQRLLLSAGTVALVQKAGFIPLGQAAPLLPPAPAETWEPLGRLGAECIRELLSSIRYSLFRADYWAQLQQHQRVVPASLLVMALQSESFHSNLTGPLVAALGERGRWLARQNPDWCPVLTAANAALDLTTWETGTLPQRRSFLEQRHQNDPEEARQLLATTLPTEPAATQAALLAALGASLSSADEPLLETYLGARSKEVRQTVVPLLARLPHSALVGRAWQRASPLLSLKRLSLGRDKLLITLPEKWDKAWLVDGVEQHTADFKGGVRAGWLGQLLAVLPPSRWTAHLGVETSELLSLAEATEWSHLLLHAWARAAYLHLDEAFAAALLLLHFTQGGLLLEQQVKDLAQVLPNEKKLALLRTQLPPYTSEIPASFPEFLGYIAIPWPTDIATLALRYLTEILAPAATDVNSDAFLHAATLLYRLERYLPAAQAAYYMEVLSPLADHPYLTPLITMLFNALRFRQQLAASLTEPSYPS